MVGTRIDRGKSINLLPKIRWHRDRQSDMGSEWVIEDFQSYKCASRAKQMFPSKMLHVL